MLLKHVLLIEGGRFLRFDLLIAFFHAGTPSSEEVYITALSSAKNRI